MYQIEILPHSFEAKIKVNILEGNSEHSGYPCWSVLLGQFGTCGTAERGRC